MNSPQTFGRIYESQLHIVSKTSLLVTSGKLYSNNPIQPRSKLFTLPIFRKFCYRLSTSHTLFLNFHSLGLTSPTSRFFISETHQATFDYFFRLRFRSCIYSSLIDARIKPNKAVDLMAPSIRLVTVQTSHFHFTPRLQWESVVP